MKQTDEGDYNMDTVRQMRSAWWCPVPHPPSVLENSVRWDHEPLVGELLIAVLSKGLFSM